MHGDVIMEVPALDWLTLTTHERSCYGSLLECLRWALGGEASIEKEAKLMQYKGCRGEGYFYGEGEQAGSRHYMATVSGALADYMGSSVRTLYVDRLGAKATRVDIQCTRAVNSPVDLPSIGRTLRTSGAAGLDGGGRPRRVDIVDNDDGLHTLYIGARRSERFLRIYNKKVGDGVGLRFEVEFKGGLARRAWDFYERAGDWALGELLAQEAEILPPLLRSFLRPEEWRGGGGRVDMKVRHAPSTDERFLNWFRVFVLPSVSRVVKGERGGEMLDMLAEVFGSVAEA